MKSSFTLLFLFVLSVNAYADDWDNQSWKPFKEQPFKEQPFKVVTSHIYAKGMQLRIVTKRPIELWCSISTKDDVILTREVIRTRPVMTTHMINVDVPALAEKVECHELVSEGVDLMMFKDYSLQTLMRR